MSRIGQLEKLQSSVSSKALRQSLDSAFEDPPQKNRVTDPKPELSGMSVLDPINSSLSRSQLKASLYKNHFKTQSKPDPRVLSHRSPESLHLPSIFQKSHFRYKSNDISNNTKNGRPIPGMVQKKGVHKEKLARKVKSLRKRGVKDFRLFILAVQFLLRFKRWLVSRYIEKKSVFYIEQHMGRFEKVKEWVITVVPLNIVLQDKTFNFDIINKKPSEKNKQKLEKLHAIVFTIIKGLIEIAKPQNTEINWFLLRYCSNGTVFPDGYLVPFEKTRLSFGYSQGITNINNDRRIMLLSFFVISRVLVNDILLKEREKYKAKSREFINLTVLSSLLQYLVVTSFARVGRNRNEWTDDKRDIEDRKMKEKFKAVRFI